MTSPVTDSALLSQQQIDTQVSGFQPSKQDRKLAAFTSVFVFALAVLIGGPVWWLTTSTYRSDGYSAEKILELFAQPTRLTFYLHVFHEKSADASDKAAPFDWHKFEQELCELPANHQSHSRLESDAVRVSFKCKREAIEASKIPEKLRKLKPAHANHLQIFVFEKTRLASIAQSQSNILLSHGQFLIGYDSREAGGERQDLIARITRQLHTHLLQLDWLTRAHHPLSQLPNLQLRFILIDPSPASFSHANAPDWWSMRVVRERYFAPLLSQLQRFLNVSVTSQHLAHLALDQSDPQKLVNTIESALVSSSVSSSLSQHLLNFVIIKRHSSSSSAFSKGPSSFMVPNWGAIHFVRSNQSEERTVMQSLLPQLLQLVGLLRADRFDEMQPPLIYFLHDEEAAALPDWQISAWLRSRSVAMLTRAVHTLNSLLELLHRVENMVISDEVALDIAAAIDSCEVARHKLTNQNAASGSEESAYFDARNALVRSERAFFHHSLLGLLYFPADQKYGIYVPLFAPVCFAILHSFYNSVKYILSLRDSATASKKNKSE